MVGGMFEGASIRAVENQLGKKGRLLILLRCRLYPVLYVVWLGYTLPYFKDPGDYDYISFNQIKLKFSGYVQAFENAA